MGDMNFSSGIDDISLAALKKACRATQERVYRAYAQPAWTLAVRLSGCEARAWDAVQSGFVRAFDRVSQLRQAERFGPWLRRIIVNQVMDQMRDRFEPIEAAGDEQATSDPAPGHALDLERALARLSPADRSVLWLHDAEGLTHGEIAELAGQSLSWSKSRLSRARARIRPLLESETESAMKVTSP
jgi:RNA polymerase sigma factor (sigma-70 family)